MIATIDADAFDALTARAQQEIDGGHLPSCQFALAHGGEVIASRTLGSASDSSRYVMASSTKPLLATVAWQLLAEGAVALEDPVAEIWPGFAANGKGAVTLEHVLLHTCGFPTAEIPDAVWPDRAARVAAMEGWELEWEPGSRSAYHGLSAHWVLAEVVARLTGQDYRDVLRARVLDPLGLDRLQLGVPLDEQGDIEPLTVTGEFPSVQQMIDAIGQPLDLPEGPGEDVLRAHAALNRAVGVPGASAVSDASSVALLYQALLHDPKGLWDADILRDATSNPRNQMNHDFPSGSAPAMRTIGLELAGADAASRFRIGLGATSPSTFGHGGAGGQIAWADPVTGVSFAFLTNGFDRDFIREYRRSRDLCALAVQCMRA